MRKFLVKNFVLDYWITLFGKTLSAPRASRIIFPLFIITGLIHTYYESPFSWSLIGLLAISLYFGFVHFNYFPVKWDELDMKQKFQYGSFKGDKLTPAQFKEWLAIVEEIKSTQEK